MQPTPTSPVTISEYERKNYYTGLSSDPPELFYRSDLETNPFPHPASADQPCPLEKSVRGASKTSIGAVWGTVAPLIIQLLKERGMRYSSLTTVRFSIEDQDGNRTLSPIVVWIALRPGSSTPEDARDASPGILRILESHGVEGAVVEWCEGVVERL